MERRTRIDGAIDATTAVLRESLATVEDVHTTIARKPFAVLRFVPVLGGVSGAVRVVHDGINSMIYGSLRGSIEVLHTVAKSAAFVAEFEDREPRAGSSADLALAAINGVAGDRLRRDDNPLAIEMSLRCGDLRVDAKRSALAAVYPDASSRLVIFVHGLAANESTWRFYAEKHFDDEESTYGSRIAAEFGHTPLYVRYNSGLHVSENGALLATLIDDIVREWPVAVEEIVLVGHSMGGLVLRSACHRGQLSGMAWVDQVRQVFFLGSPHLGSPLERFGNVASWLLERFDVSRAFSRLINKRSAGIKDLRFGSIVDENWSGSDVDGLLAGSTGDVPLLPRAKYYVVAATASRDPSHPLAAAVGDGLVPTKSATGFGDRAGAASSVAGLRYLGAVSHMGLLNHPDVDQQLRAWLRGDAQSDE